MSQICDDGQTNRPRLHSAIMQRSVKIGLYGEVILRGDVLDNENRVASSNGTVTVFAV